MPSRCCCSSNQIIGFIQQHTACLTPLGISLRKRFHCPLDVDLLRLYGSHLCTCLFLKIYLAHWEKTSLQNCLFLHIPKATDLSLLFTFVFLLQIGSSKMQPFVACSLISGHHRFHVFQQARPRQRESRRCPQPPRGPNAFSLFTYPKQLRFKTLANLLKK